MPATSATADAKSATPQRKLRRRPTVAGRPAASARTGSDGGGSTTAPGSGVVVPVGRMPGLMRVLSFTRRELRGESRVSSPEIWAAGARLSASKPCQGVLRTRPILSTSFRLACRIWDPATQQEHPGGARRLDNEPAQDRGNLQDDRRQARPAEPGLL